MQAVAGKRPSRPFRPPRQGDSKKARLPLLWNGSSHGLLSPSIETHLKQSMAHPADERDCARCLSCNREMKQRTRWIKYFLKFSPDIFHFVYDLIMSDIKIYSPITRCKNVKDFYVISRRGRKDLVAIDKVFESSSGARWAIFIRTNYTRGVLEAQQLLILLLDYFRYT